MLSSLSSLYKEMGKYEEQIATIKMSIDEGSRTGVYCRDNSLFSLDAADLIGALIMAGRKDNARELFSENEEIIDARLAIHLKRELGVA